MRLSRLRVLAISLTAVLMLIVGTAGQAFACVAPDPDDNLQLESAVSVPSMSPSTSLTLAVDRQSAAPGQNLTYTALVTNSGTSLTLTGTIEVTNPHRSTVSLAAWYDYVSFDSKGHCSSNDNDNDGHNSNHWVPLAGAAGAKTGYTASGKAPISTGETFSAVPVPSNNVTYSTGSDTISGTSIGRQATARWKFTAVIPLTSSQAAALFKGSAAYPIRASFHAEPSTGNSHDSNADTITNAPFCRQLTALKASGSAADMRVAFTLPDGSVRTISKTTVAALGSIAPGASVSVKTTYKVPVPAAKGAGETDSAYIARLASLDGARLSASATARSGSTGSLVGPAGPVYITETLPILSLTKAGPASVEAGATAAYDLGLANTSSAPASSILLTDSLPDGAVIPVSGAPATLAPGATATAHASYPVPAAQPAGDLTDTAKLRWTDAAGNWYGPISSNATSAVTRSITTVVVTASGGTLTYGGTVPAITPSYSGWRTGDGPLVLTTTPVCTTTATNAGGAGTYKTSCTGAAAPAYVFVYVDGSITVSPALLTVTAPSGSMTYGGTVPAITPSYSGWVQGEGPSVLTTAPTCSTAAMSTSGIGTYKSSCSGAAAANYTFAYVDGSVAVAPALVTLTASSDSMTYGATVPTITPSYSGLVNGEDPSVLTTAPTCAAAATSTSPTGTYSSTCSGAVAANYTFAYVEGKVSVNPSVVIVTASSGSVTYGGTIPPISPAYSGWQNGDGPDVLTSAPVCTTTATSASGVGTYTTSCSGAAAPNYTFTYADGTITINPALLTITAPSGSMTYGGTVPAIAPSYSGWRNGEGPATLTTAPTCTTTATSTSGVGAYTTSCSGAAALNYTFNYVDGSVAVTAALLTITASSDSMPYGGTVPVITPIYAGWQNGETPSVLTTAPACTTNATSASPAGSYETSCSGAAAANYTLKYVDGTLTVEGVITTGLALSPQSGGPLPLNSTYTLTVTAMGSNGKPVSAAPITLTVTGSNATTANLTTGTDGTATFTYTGKHEGTDIAQATCTDASGSLASNTASVIWSTPTAAIATSQIHGVFYPVDSESTSFLATPASTPAFEQDFPTVNFDPPGGTVPNDHSGVGYMTRPFTDVTTDLAGNYSGTIVAQGNGLQAGVGSMVGFDAVFTGTYTVAAAGNQTFNYFSDDGWMLGIGGGAAPVSGPWVGTPASGLSPFESYPLMASYNIPSSPAPNTVTVYFPAPGVYPYEIDYFEIRGAQLSLTVTNASTGHSVPPTASIVLSPLAPAPAQRGIAQTFTAAVTDLGGNPVAGLPVSINVSGANTTDLTATSDSRGIATFTYASGIAGTDNLEAFALYGGTPIISNIVAQTWTTAPAVPLIGAASPAEGTVITSPTSISASIGAPSGATITDWTVSYQSAAPGSGSVGLANGSGTPPATLATFDPTVLANGPYMISIAADASDGSREVANIEVTVAGNLKLGRYGVTYQDANVAVGGIPISVTRSYDSFDKSTGAFGVGWQLGVANFRVYTDGALGAGGWSQYATSCFMAGLGGGLCQMAWATARPHFVTVVCPDGHTEIFDFTPTGGSNLFWLGASAFTARPGTTSTLTATGDQPLSYKGDGNLYGGISGSAIYAPTRFTLTAKDGTDYVLDTVSGLISETDRVGNSVTVDAAGIHSSLGPSITFIRDAAGRITELDKPGGAKVLYEYNAGGDLVGVTDELGNKVTYEYDGNHNLTRTVDPTGHAFSTVAYDAAGRITSITDAAGHTTAISSDPNLRQERVTDATGRKTTVSSFNAAGDLVRVDVIADSQVAAVPNGFALVSDNLSFNKKLTTTPARFDQTAGGAETVTATTTYTYDENHNLTSRTDPSGSVWAATYDGDGNLLSFTDAGGNIIRVTYDEYGFVVTWTDPLGATTSYVWNANGTLASSNGATAMDGSYTYDGSGNAISWTDRSGNTWHYAYDSAGRKISQTDPLDNVTTYTYDAAGRLTKTTDPAGGVTASTYDAAGNLLSTTDPDDNVTRYAYDALGFQSSMTDPAGKVTSYGRDGVGRVTSVTDPTGAVTHTTYDAAGQVVTSTDAAGNATIFTYDGFGNQTSTTDALGRTTTSAYDRRGLLTSTTNASGGVTRFAYDADGNQTSVTDPDDRVTTATYDGCGDVLTWSNPAGATWTYTYGHVDQLTKISDPTGRSYSIEYTPTGAVAAVTDPTGSASHYGYDAAGREISYTDRLGNVTTYDYDVAGRLTGETDALGHTTHVAYDPAGRVTSTTSPTGIKTSFEYDPRGLNTKLTDGLGAATSYSYDAAGRLIGTTDAAGASTTYAYDARGLQTKMTDALGHSISFAYDAASQQTAMTDANGSVWHTAYDSLGNVASATDPLGHATTYAYDTAGVLTNSTDPRGIATAYAYSTAGRLASITTPTASISTTYDAAGRRTTMTDPVGLTTYGYDTAGRLASIAGPGANASYTYDLAGNRATMTASGKTTSYTYDAANRLTTVSRPDLGAFGFAYDADGQLVTLSRPNGVTSTNSYDGAGRLTGLTYKNSGGTTIAAYGYTLDATGNRTSASTNGATEHYALDAVGRLTGVTYADGTAVTFGYDAAGNRTSMTQGSSTTAYTYNAASELTSAGSTTYTYDAAGNRIAAGSTSYSYDDFGNLASQTSAATTIAYQTNGDGLRVSASGGSTASTYNWDQAAGLPSLLSDGTNSYLSADTQLLAEVGASTSVYPLTDALGSVQAQADGSGAITATASYGAYGDPRSSTGSIGSLGYTGALSDASGSVYLHARSLDTSTGTFTARDPMTPGGTGVTGFNPYAYAGQNPVTNADPTGQMATETGEMNFVTIGARPVLGGSVGVGLVKEFVFAAAVFFRIYLCLVNHEGICYLFNQSRSNSNGGKGGKGGSGGGSGGGGGTGQGAGDWQPPRGARTNVSGIKSLAKDMDLDPAKALKYIERVVKKEAGLGPADNVIVGPDGTIYGPSGENLGNILESQYWNGR